MALRDHLRLHLRQSSLTAKLRRSHTGPVPESQSRQGWARRRPKSGAVVDEWTEVFGSERLTGVQLIHVDADGLPALDKPGPDGLPKRSFGQMAGAVCVLGLQGHGGVNVAEGLADALALAARLPWRAVCMGGTAGFHRLELARWLAQGPSTLTRAMSVNTRWTGSRCSLRTLLAHEGTGAPSLDMARGPGDAEPPGSPPRFTWSPIGHGLFGLAGNRTGCQQRMVTDWNSRTC